MNLYDNIPDDKLDEAIAELDAKVARKAQISRILPRLEAERDRLTALEEQRRKELKCEQGDVEALRERSPLVLWLSLTDKLEARLEKEEFEALEAEAAWQSAHDELESVSQEIRRLTAERRSFGLCEEHARELRDRKKAIVMNHNAEKAAEIAGIEAKIAALETQRREVNEAVDAAERMITLCAEAVSALGPLAASYDVYSRYGKFRYTRGSTLDVDIEAALRNAESYIISIQRLLPTLYSEVADLKGMDLPVPYRDDAVPMEMPALSIRGISHAGTAEASRICAADIRRLSADTRTIVDNLAPVRTLLDSRIRALRLQADDLVK